jgi:hypothetical protein
MPGKRETDARKAKARRAAIAAGTYRPMVDADKARGHVLQVHEAGLPYTTIAKLSGVPLETVNRLINGTPSAGRPPTTRLWPDTEDALLAVRADLVPDEGYALAVGSRRRLQALAWAGWPSAYVASRVPMGRNYLQAVRRGVTGSTMTAEKARRIKAVTRELWMADPVEFGVPASRASQVRTFASRNGWVSLAAWENIDDPAAEPVGVA